jgi:hypothetical protein
MGKAIKPKARKQRRENLRLLYHDPVIIPQGQENFDESPLPEENSTWPRIILIGGSIAALFCVWRFAPAQITALWKWLVQSIFR